MTDVRLTATNPEDSSVVPVACNSRGELLVTENVIERIDNDVTINGELHASTLSVTGTEEGNYVVGNSTHFLFCKPSKRDHATFYTEYDGTTRWRYYSETFLAGTLFACNNDYALEVRGSGNNHRWHVDWSGNQTVRDILITTEPDNASYWRTADGNDDSPNVYTGPVLSVRDELEFLRAQVRALMEKLKMSPEGGWPVWDGSDESS